MNVISCTSTKFIVFKKYVIAHWEGQKRLHNGSFVAWGITAAGVVCNDGSINRENEPFFLMFITGLGQAQLETAGGRFISWPVSFICRLSVNLHVL